MYLCVCIYIYIENLGAICRLHGSHLINTFPAHTKEAIVAPSLLDTKTRTFHLHWLKSEESLDINKTEQYLLLRIGQIFWSHSCHQSKAETVLINFDSYFLCLVRVNVYLSKQNSKTTLMCSYKILKEFSKVTSFTLFSQTGPQVPLVYSPLQHS